MTTSLNFFDAEKILMDAKELPTGLYDEKKFFPWTIDEDKAPYLDTPEKVLHNGWLHEIIDRAEGILVWKRTVDIITVWSEFKEELVQELQRRPDWQDRKICNEGLFGLYSRKKTISWLKGWELEFPEWITRYQDTVNLVTYFRIYSSYPGGGIIFSVPKEIGRFSGLQKLELRGTFSTLPDSINELGELRTLVLQSRELTTFPEVLELPRLERLFLNVCGLTEVPPRIGKFTSLKVLELDENNITKISDEIGELANLIILHLRHNPFTSMPKSMGRLHKLRYLYIGYSKYTILPPEVRELSISKDNGPEYLHIQWDRSSHGDGIAYSSIGFAPSRLR